MKEKFRILLVEDEENLRSAIELNLDLEGYEVVSCNNGKKALELFKGAKFHLVVLDVMLPEIDGFKVCQTIRLSNNSTPVIFLTAKNSSQDRIQGLKLADDYLAKPFNLEELLIRVGKLLERSFPEKSNDKKTYQFGNNTINFETFEIETFNGITKRLSSKEIMLLRLFTDKENEVISRSTILETVWGYNVYPSTRTIDNFILAFRKYFEHNPKEPVFFHSVRGVGYKFQNQQNK